MQDVEMGVIEITRRIISIIEKDETLQNITVRGEISNFKLSGPHAYFSLKEEDYLLNCVMFNAIYRHPHEIKEGTIVKATGSVRIYAKRGTYQFYAESIQEGMDYGELYRKLEELKSKLKKEGIFDKPKKSIPSFPKRIAVVSSKTSAAFHDVVKTVNKRYPLATILLFHTSVQGKDAFLEIVKALDAADRSDADVVLLVRGGGSIEDLWNFNEESVVKKVYGMKKPVITGVGHEIDTTLVDYVADKRAPTPTGAAEYATPDIEELKKHMKVAFSNIVKKFDHDLDQKTYHLVNLKKRLDFLSPVNQTVLKGEKVDEAFIKVKKNFENILKEKSAMFLRVGDALIHSRAVRMTEIMPERLYAKMDTLKRIITNSMSFKSSMVEKAFLSLSIHDPYEPLKRGYAIVSKDDHHVKSVEELKKKDKIKLELFDGKILSEVLEIDKNGK